MKLIIFMILLSMIFVSISSAEQVTFTVKDRFIETQFHTQWYIFVETVNGELYWIYDSPWTGQPSDAFCNVYQSFAPNTTHTVNINGHRIME